MRWLLRLLLLRLLGSRVMLALAVIAWFRSALRRPAATPQAGAPPGRLEPPGRTGDR